MKNGVCIYDIETLINFFSYYAIDRDSEEEVMFYIHEDVNQLSSLLDHLDGLKGMIGFNNLEFDYPIIHFLMINREELLQLSTEKLIKTIYAKSQEIINETYSQIPDRNVLIPQLDLYKIWHFDNNARRTSLKKLQIAMNARNVQDMPFKHYEHIKSKEDIKLILSYNKNDVIYTKEFYKLTIPKIQLRTRLAAKYNINCLNWADSKIGEELVLKLYCDATNQNPWDVRKKRTYREILKFKECIPSYIQFSTSEFNNLLDYLKGIEVKELKDSFSYSFNYNGFIFDLGTGGIHGCIKEGIYEEDEEYTIIDADVSSLYPSLAIALRLYPEHLGEEFITVYEKEIVIPRLKAKKEGDKVMSDGFKLAANAVYGKSNSQYSFLYDPLYTLKTTLAGQLSLCMLSEMILTNIPDVTMLQINTDGLTIKIPKKYTSNYYEVCKKWEKMTSLSLEYVEYKKMVIRDVNNYLSISTSGKIKYKGAFKPNNEMRKDGEYHKSFSQGIVATAVAKYFIDNIPVEDTVYNCTDIFEFCKTGNTTGDWVAETFEMKDGNKVNVIQQQKNNRYYLSNNGVRFQKRIVKDGKLSEIEYESEKLVTIFNVYEKKNFSEYDINYQYYIDECYKIIHRIDGTLERLEKEKREQKLREKMEREEANFIKFCINKVPTERQLSIYGKDWLIEKYGEIKPKVKSLRK